MAGVHRRCRGAYAAVVLILVTASWDSATLTASGRWCSASANPQGRGVHDRLGKCGAGSLGFKLIRDVAPGEAVYISQDGELYTRHCDEQTCTPCIFEHVYFARPDSMIDGISVYKSRLRMGEKLAQKIKRERPDHDIDVVIPIPDTVATAAVELANALGIKYREGFVKNRYIGRTFIMPGQSQRKKSVKQKLNATPWNSRTRMCCWWMTPSFVARPANRLLKWPARPGQQGLFRFRGASGALSQCLRHRYAVGERAGGLWPHG